MPAFILDSLIVSIPVTLLSIPIFGFAMFKMAPLLDQAALQQTQEIPPEMLQVFMVFWGLGLLVQLLYFVLFVLYFAWQESGEHQATWGKRALGLKVMSMDGKRISFWRGVGRTASKVISYMTMYIGFMLAGWTAKKQALHDLIVNTVVVYKEN